jgi:hypothetical protein
VSQDERSVPVFGDHVVARASDKNVALRFEDSSWTYAEFVQECASRAALFEALRVTGAPHIGLLLDNVPDFASGSVPRRCSGGRSWASIPPGAARDWSATSSTPSAR